MPSKKAPRHRAPFYSNNSAKALPPDGVALGIELIVHVMLLGWCNGATIGPGIGMILAGNRAGLMAQVPRLTTRNVTAALFMVNPVHLVMLAQQNLVLARMVMGPAVVMRMVCRIMPVSGIGRGRGGKCADRGNSGKGDNDFGGKLHGGSPFPVGKIGR